MVGSVPAEDVGSSILVVVGILFAMSEVGTSVVVSVVVE